VGMERLRRDLEAIRRTCLDQKTRSRRLEARLRAWDLEERGMLPHHLFPEMLAEGFSSAYNDAERSTSDQIKKEED